jgi:hypothetical protein
MRQGRLARTAYAAAAISVIGLGAGAVATAAQAAPVARGGHYSEQTVVVSCEGRLQVRPGTFTLACADGNDYLTRLSWTSWGPGLASATGIQEQNDCNPYCAAGHFHAYPVNVILWGGTPVRNEPGTDRYTKITLLYPGARPAYAGATSTESLFS